jgi:hypothetical protein
MISVLWLLIKYICCGLKYGNKFVSLQFKTVYSECQTLAICGPTTLLELNYVSCQKCNDRGQKTHMRSGGHLYSDNSTLWDNSCSLLDVNWLRTETAFELRARQWWLPMTLRKPCPHCYRLGSCNSHQPIIHSPPDQHTVSLMSYSITTSLMSYSITASLMSYSITLEWVWFFLKDSYFINPFRTTVLFRCFWCLDFWVRNLLIVFKFPACNCTGSDFIIN